MKHWIETERIILRPITLEDARDMYEYAHDHEVCRYVTWDAHQSVEQTQAIIRDFFLPKESNEAWIPTFAVVLKDTHKMIGTCDTVAPITIDGNVEIGYSLNRTYWNHGYATESCKALCAYLFNEEGVRRIKIRHHVDNIGSRRVIEKCGFIKEGVERQLVKFEDGYADIAIYSMFKEELK